MAEALAALGIASNIVQLISFTSDLISKGHEIYTSADGELVEYLELETITNHIQTLNSQIAWKPKLDKKGKKRTLTKTESRLKELCEGCNDVARHLLTALKDLKAEGKNKRWKSFRQALNSVWNQEKIQNLTERLERYRRTIDTVLLQLLR